MAGSRETQARGQAMESLARQYLEQQGLAFIAANVRNAGGEIDLIMREQNCLVFVEVRYRAGAQFGSAKESVNAAKQRKLLAAAQTFLQREPKWRNSPCRFDVIAMTGQPVQLEWIRHAFGS